MSGYVFPTGLSSTPIPVVDLREHMTEVHGLTYPNVSDEKVAAIHTDIHRGGRMARPHTHPEMTHG